METPEFTGKRGLRTLLLDRRRALSTVDRTASARRLREALAELLRTHVPAGGTLAAYVPMAGEPGGEDLPEWLAAQGVRVLLPVLREDMGLDWGEFTGSLVSGRLKGLREPSGPVTPLGSVRLLLVPALAVGAADGVRLGRGGGSYDRALAEVPAGVPIVALLHDGELLDEVPGEPHDRPVTGVITPAGGYAGVGNLTAPPAGRFRHGAAQLALGKAEC